MLPAVAQGALAIECRADDAEMLALIAPLDDAATHAAVRAERACLRRLEGGCQVPIAAYAVVEDRSLTLRGLVGTPDGMQIVRATEHGVIGNAEQIGTTLAERLIDQGADGILERLSGVVPAIEAPSPNEHAVS